MRTDRFARRWTCPVLLLATAVGCHILPHESVPVLVRDAETHSPIPGAQVRLSTALTQPSRDSSATTGADGVARLRPAPAGDAATVAQELPADRGPAGIVMELYAGPRPTVDLVVPTGFRGLVKAEVRVRDDAPVPADRRSFCYPVPPSGEVEVIGPPVLRHLLPPDFTARYADGPPLAREAKDSEVGFRWVRTTGSTEYFIVGTQADCDEFRKSFEQEGPGAGRSTSGEGKGKGRGGRGRRGGG